MPYIDPAVFIKEGVYRNISESEYHSWDFCSNSFLTKLYESPAHAKASRQSSDEPTPDYFRTGTLLHQAVLEPDLFHQNHIPGRQCEATKKSGDPCSNDAKSLVWGENGSPMQVCGVHARVKTEVPGAFLVPRSTYDQVLAMRNALESHPWMKEHFFDQRNECDVELSIVSSSLAVQNAPFGVDTAGPYGTDPIFKGRIDITAPFEGGTCIIDLKTTSSSPSFFERAAYNYGYHRQAAFYRALMHSMGRTVNRYFIASVEKKAPYGVVIYEVPYILLDAAERQLVPLIDKYLNCLSLDEWPSYSTEVRTLGLSDYEYQQIEEEYDAYTQRLKWEE